MEIEKALNLLTELLNEATRKGLFGDAASVVAMTQALQSVTDHLKYKGELTKEQLND